MFRAAFKMTPDERHQHISQMYPHLKTKADFREAAKQLKMFGDLQWDGLDVLPIGTAANPSPISREQFVWLYRAACLAIDIEKAPADSDPD